PAPTGAAWASDLLGLVRPAGAGHRVDDRLAELGPGELVARLVGAAAGVMGAEPGDHVDGLAADVLAALPVQRAGEGPAEADLGLAGRLQADPGGLVVGLVELDPECAVEVLGAGAAGARRGDLRRPGDDDRPVVLLGGLDALAA